MFEKLDFSCGKVINPDVPNIGSPDLLRRNPDDDETRSFTFEMVNIVLAPTVTLTSFVSFVALLDDALMNPFDIITFEPFLAKHRALQGDFNTTPLSTLSPRKLCWIEDDSDAAFKQARTKEESILLLSFPQPCTQPLLLKFQPFCDPWWLMRH